MKIVVPQTSHYGALITNDSFQVLMRKKINSSKGLFLRWEHDSVCEAIGFVCSRLIEDCGVNAKFVVTNPHVTFFKGGTLVNFIFVYSDGDVDAAGLEWVSVREAWEALAKLDDDKAHAGECDSLSGLNGWIHCQRRKVAEKEINGGKNNLYVKFDELCHRARAVLDIYPRYFDGIGMYSEFMQSMINAAKVEIDGIDNFSLYLEALCARVEKPGRSFSREKGLVDVVRFSLANAYLYLREERRDVFLDECLRAEKFIGYLKEIYSKGSPEIRSRAIKGGSATRRGCPKPSDVKVVESIILSVLENRAVKKRQYQNYEISRMIAGDVWGEISNSGLGGIFDLEDLHEFILNFIIENKAARALIK